MHDWSVGTKASISCWFDIPRMHRPFYENGIPSSFSIFLLFPSLTLPFYRHPTGLFLQPPSPPPILLSIHWKPNGNCVSRNSFFPPPPLTLPPLGLHLATIGALLSNFFHTFFYTLISTRVIFNCSSKARYFKVICIFKLRKIYLNVVSLLWFIFVRVKFEFLVPRFASSNDRCYAIMKFLCYV